MTASEFIQFFNDELGYAENAFIKNFGNDEKEIHEWANILIAWLEMSTEGDAKRYYEEYYDVD